jgi:hypothetical protein
MGEEEATLGETFPSIDDKGLLRSIAWFTGPFVNRKEEVLECVICNAYLVATVRVVEKSVNDWRSHSFPYCAQMFGARKSRLGEEIIPQVKECVSGLPTATITWADFDNVFMQDEYPAQLIPYMKEVIIEMADARFERVNLLGVSSQETLIERIHNEVGVGSSIARAIEVRCISNGSPTIFHFDDAGNLPVAVLRFLRDECLSLFIKINKGRVSNDNNKTPLLKLFPFFFSVAEIWHFVSWPKSLWILLWVVNG